MNGNYVAPTSLVVQLDFSENINRGFPLTFGHHPVGDVFCDFEIM